MGWVYAGETLNKWKYYNIVAAATVDGGSAGKDWEMRGPYMFHGLDDLSARKLNIHVLMTQHITSFQLREFFLPMVKDILDLLLLDQSTIFNFFSLLFNN